MKRYTREEIEIGLKAIEGHDTVVLCGGLPNTIALIIRQLLADLDAKEKEAWQYRQSIIDIVTALRTYGNIYDDKDMHTDADTMECLMAEYSCTS